MSLWLVVALATVGQASEDVRYWHGQHKKLGVTLTCEACHESSSSGVLSYPAPDHKPCSNSACHAAEFERRESTLCRACHVAERPLDSRLRGLKANGEFDARFDHAKHLVLPVLAQQSECSSCHPSQHGEAAPASDELAPQHRQCASCHEALQTPQMDDCAACHVRAKIEGASKWRVRDRFSHDKHRDRAPDAECARCHVDVKKRSEPARPAKADCAKCHNGAQSFSVTGFECYRCHGSDQS